MKFPTAAGVLPTWLLVLGLLALLWVFLPVETIWRCRKCGRLAWGRERHEVAFCPRCGAPRPRGPAGARVPLTVEPSHLLAEDKNQLVCEILLTAGIADALPAGTKAVARISAVVPAGTSVAGAHPTWRPEVVGDVHGLPPYARREPDAVVPSGIVRVEIDAVERQSGGMSSFYGFEGLFVSLLLSLPEGAIWDARAEDAI